jgi:hypothetical protein
MEKDGGMRIPPSFIFWCVLRSSYVVRFPYVVRSSRAANTSAARREDRVEMRTMIARTTGQRPALRLRGLRVGDPHHDCADYGPEPRTTIARTTGRRPAPRLRGLRAGAPHHDCADYGPETRTTIARITGRRPAPRLTRACAERYWIGKS